MKISHYLLSNFSVLLVRSIDSSRASLSMKQRRSQTRLSLQLKRIPLQQIRPPYNDRIAQED